VTASAAVTLLLWPSCPGRLCPRLPDFLGAGSARWPPRRRAAVRCFYPRSLSLQVNQFQGFNQKFLGGVTVLEYYSLVRADAVS
jgi:hypothetical protein